MTKYEIMFIVRTDIDEEAINAEFDNGILKVTVPKTTKKETKRVIEIN